MVKKGFLTCLLTVTENEKSNSHFNLLITSAQCMKHPTLRPRSPTNWFQRQRTQNGSLTKRSAKCG